jgi:hypothetical protein
MHAYIHIYVQNNIHAYMYMHRFIGTQGYACIHTHIRTEEHIRILAYYTYTHSYMHKYKPACIHMHTYELVQKHREMGDVALNKLGRCVCHVCVCMHVCIYLCTYTCVYTYKHGRNEDLTLRSRHYVLETYTCIPIYIFCHSVPQETYIHTYVHTYIHTYISTGMCLVTHCHKKEGNEE